MPGQVSRREHAQYKGFQGLQLWLQLTRAQAATATIDPTQKVR